MLKLWTAQFKQWYPHGCNLKFVEIIHYQMSISVEIYLGFSGLEKWCRHKLMVVNFCLKTAWDWPPHELVMSFKLVVKRLRSEFSENRWGLDLRMEGFRPPKPCYHVIWSATYPSVLIQTVLYSLVLAKRDMSLLVYLWNKFITLGPLLI